MSEYAAVQGGALKLKGASIGIKKKKKKRKDKDKESQKRMEQIQSIMGEGSTPEVDRRTKAELAFAQVQERRSAEMILKKASKPHKERIMEFNSHLDTLTEHFDIPKVSWTK